MEIVVWHSDSCSEVFSQYFTIYNHSLQRVIELVWGFWFLLYYQCWAFTRTPFGYPWRSWSFVSSRQAASHALSDHKWGGYLIGLSYNPGPGPGKLQGWSAFQLQAVFTNRVRSPVMYLCWALQFTPSQLRVRERTTSPSSTSLGLSCSYTFRASSTPPPLYCPGEVLGSTLPCALASEGREHLSRSYDLRVPLPSATGAKRVHLSPAHVIIWQMRGGFYLPCSHSPCGSPQLCIRESMFLPKAMKDVVGPRNSHAVSGLHGEIMFLPSTMTDWKGQETNPQSCPSFEWKRGPVCQHYYREKNVWYAIEERSGGECTEAYLKR